MVVVKTAEFNKASALALKNAPLQRTMGRVMHHFNDARAAAIEQVTEPVWEQLRSQAADIKRHTMAHLDYYLEMVDLAVSRNGGHVHFAQSVQEANSIVLEIARRQQVKRVIKGKSMVSEELGLNEVLEAQGIEAVETDLGEYIIQLAHETPFHIIAPAMHKSRQEVSDLFQQWLKVCAHKGHPGAVPHCPHHFAGCVRQGGHGSHRRQLRRGGDGHGGAGDQRGQRADGHLHAEGPRGHRGHGEGGAGPGRRDGVPASAG